MDSNSVEDKTSCFGRSVQNVKLRDVLYRTPNLTTDIDRVEPTGGIFTKPKTNQFFVYNSIHTKQSMASLELQLSSAIDEALASFIDEDICEYISSTLIENPHDEDARENVKELIRGSLEEGDADQIIENFFEKLSLGDMKENENGSSAAVLDGQESQMVKKLDKAMTLKDHDIQTFAGGISAEGITSSAIDNEDEVMSNVASFYANMIDISNNEAVISERNRRKEKQKALREAAEEAERKRAIEEAMNVLNDDTIDGENPDEMLDAANDNSADVHIRNLDLPNLRGGGPDLLQNASLTLAKGRNYGLMGRNGKLLLLSFKYSFKRCCRY